MAVVYFGVCLLKVETKTFGNSSYLNQHGSRTVERFDHKHNRTKTERGQCPQSTEDRDRGVHEICCTKVNEICCRGVNEIC